MIQDPCSSCRGTGQAKKRTQISLKIPPGIDSGQKMKLTGEGEAGERGAMSGDLYVVINILPHDFFTREQADVLCDVPITFTQAALGADIDVPTLDGIVAMKIPAGTQSHKNFRLKGKGIAHLDRHGRGDQLVRVLIETPSKLTSEQKDLLKKFDELGGGTSHPVHHRFFERVKNFFG